MMDFLIYDVKVAVLIAVFYMFYRLMLARETFHRVNRLVLLLTAVASFVLPLCVITIHQTVTMEAMPVTLPDDLSAEAAPLPAPVVETPLWQQLLPALFIIGMLATLGHSLMSMLRILTLIRRSEKHPQDDGTTICVTDNADVSPFSWMHYIVMNRGDFAEGNAAILAHERGHIRLRHSCDLLLVDLLTALQWFNPAMWMLRQDLRAIHEYEADGEVLSQGINARQYQYLLVSKAASIGGYSLANGISHSTLKNRINMMLHKKSSSRSLLKLFALLPVVAVALALNAREVTDVVYLPEAPVVESPLAEPVSEAAQPEKAVVTETVAVAVEGDGNEKFIVKGLVYDNGEDILSPVVGAVVKVVGTTRGTVTDRKGKFRIEVSQGDKLEVSYVGFESTTIGVSKAFSDAGREHLIGIRKEGTNPNVPYDVVEEMPQFVGGQSGLMEYLARNVRYPEEAEKAGLQGRVIVNFVIECDGSVTNARVVRSIAPSLDAEALRVVSSMPNWTPGKLNGKAVRVKYTVPITFKLTGSPEPQDSQAKNILYILDGKKVDEAVIKALDRTLIKHIDVLKDKDSIRKYTDEDMDVVFVITTNAAVQTVVVGRYPQ